MVPGLPLRTLLRGRSPFRYGSYIARPFNNLKNTPNTVPITIAITNEQKIKVTLAPMTASGNPATMDGIPTWTVTSGDATVEPAEGGLSAYLVSGSVGATNIEVTADADLGEGVRQLTDAIGLNVVPAEAAGLGLIAGEAEQK